MAVPTSSLHAIVDAPNVERGGRFENRPYVRVGSGGIALSGSAGCGGIASTGTWSEVLRTVVVVRSGDNVPGVDRVAGVILSVFCVDFRHVDLTVRKVFIT